MATPPPEATGPVDVEQSTPIRTEPSSSHGEDSQLETSSLSPEDAADTVPSGTSLPYPPSSHANQSDAAHLHLEHGYFDGQTIPSLEQAATPHPADNIPKRPAIEDAERPPQNHEDSLGEAEKTAADTGEKHGTAESDVPLLERAENAASGATKKIPRVKRGSLGTGAATASVDVLAGLNRSLLKEIPKIVQMLVLMIISTMSNKEIEGSKAVEVSEKPKSCSGEKVERTIRSLSSEEFKASTPLTRQNSKRPGHFISDSPIGTLYAIEVLSNEHSGPGSRLPRRRHIHNKPPDVSAADHNIPSRIWIRSTYLLNLLQHISGLKLNHGGNKISVEEHDSLAFLYPFKFFVTYADKIRAETDRLRDKLHDDSEAEPPQAAKGSTDPPMGGKLMSEGLPSDPTASIIEEEGFESKKALEYLELTMKLVDVYLKPLIDLRDDYRKAAHDTITFENLWLLFEAGGLLFEREPQADHPPQISRTIHFSGGRQILNNSEFKTPEIRRDIPGKDSKGSENAFCIHHYRLSFNGEFYGPVPDRLTMPAWEGERSVFDLKLFPLQFVRKLKDHGFESLEQYKSHVRKRGEKFMALKSIDHGYYYSGEGIGAHRELYNSPVVVDFKLQTRDTEQASGLLGWMETVIRSELDVIVSGLSIYSGDHREVQESTSRENNPDCIYPGCCNNDFIHDDILLDYQIAEPKLKDHARTSAKFEPSQKVHLTEDDKLLFPSFILGYVLKNRVWRKMHLDSLKAIEDEGNRFETLRIPQKHKNILSALVSMCDKESSKYPMLDVVSGKGQGIVILLHGKAGVGKTATAEAMAADLKRPLYPITYADLGDKPSTVETNLGRIFRYGQRWNCILLLDEADVFLAPRGVDETKRNSIVSIFLRNLEWYPGLIFLTTNLLKDFDEAILDRIHVKLHYPPLDEEFTVDIFKDHFKRINGEHASEDRMVHGEDGKAIVKYQVSKANMDEILRWRKQHYPGTASPNWLNGRQIRLMFQMALAFARKDMENYGGMIANIEKRHFEMIAKSMDDFREDRRIATDINS